MIHTTLNRIRKRRHLLGDWHKLLENLGKTTADDEPLALLTVLESNGLEDALWCLSAEPQQNHIWRLYAVRCVLHVRHLMRDERSLIALEVAERHALGAATDSELIAAGDAAKDVPNLRHHSYSDGAFFATVAARAAYLTTHDTVPVEAAVLLTTWELVDTEITGQISNDLRALLAAHHAQPGDTCELVKWWETGEQQ